MSEQRRLTREMGLGQVLMLGTAGTIAAEIFVLTGHVAGRAGPASLLVLGLVGLASYSFALNYSELATTYPVTGGALTYVREAYGNGLVAFLVGSMSTLSSAFYAALSAVGFAYSLSVFIPGIPIVPTTLAVVAAFVLLHILGATNVGRAQLALGAVLLTLLGLYTGFGFVRETGFSLQRLLPDGEFFVYEGTWANAVGLLRTMALIFNAFVGFEIIADDAEEIKHPRRNIPIGILGSLTVIILIYLAVTAVTLGAVPWPELAGSETALSDAAVRFMPQIGPPLIGLAGIIATLTSINTAMLAATRSALTLSRTNLWPRLMSRLGRLRTPYAATLVVGGIVAAVAAVGLVDFLSYISSSGYLFVVLWASLAMIRLRRTDGRERSFKAPLFPLTAYIAAGTCVIVILFTAPTALAFGAGLLILLTAFYYLRGPLAELAEERARAVETARDRLLVAVANPHTADGLVRLAANLSEEQPGSPIEILAVAPVEHERLPTAVDRLASRYARDQDALMRQVSQALLGRNVPFYTQVRMAQNVVQGIKDEITRRGDVRLLLMGWPGPLKPEELAEHPVAQLLEEAHVDMAVFLNRGMVSRPKRVLVPFGGGIHSRLALRLALDLVQPYEGDVTALRLVCGIDGTPGETLELGREAIADAAYEEEAEEDELRDELLLARESIDTELGGVPEHLYVKAVCEETIRSGILREATHSRYDLVVLGAALARDLESELFGSLTDTIAEALPTSVLLVRRYEPEAAMWLRRQVKEMVDRETEEVAEMPGSD